MLTSCASSWSTYQQGKASWYGKEFKGRPTASGEKFDPGDLTAAHATLPFNTRVKVTNLQNGDSVVVEINDRFPNTRGRVIDLSRKAFSKIADTDEGVIPVKLELKK